MELISSKPSRVFTFAPSVGYLVTDQWMFGGQIYVFDVEQGNADVSFFRFAPFARYYLQSGESSNGFFLTGGIGIGSQRSGIQQTGADNRIREFSLSVGAGKNFFLRPDLALEGLLVFEHFDYNGEFVDDRLEVLRLDVNLQPFLGGSFDDFPAVNLGPGSALINVPAQIQWQGKSLDGGSFAINLSPKIGLFLSDHIMLGGQVIASVLGSENSTSFGYGLIPLVRYYFLPLANRLFAFGGLEAGFQKSPGEEDSLWKVEFGPGLNYFITPHTSVEGQLLYGYNDLGIGPGQDQILIRVGLQFFLRK